MATILQRFQESMVKLYCEHSFTSAACRLLCIKIRFPVKWFSCYAILVARDENCVAHDMILVAQETRRDW